MFHVTSAPGGSSKRVRGSFESALMTISARGERLPALLGSYVLKLTD